MSETEMTALPEQAPGVPFSRTKKTVALTFAAFFVNLGKLALSVALAHFLSVAELAAYNQTLLAYQTLIPVLGLGIPQAIFYLMSRHEGRLRALVNECFALLLSAGVAYSLFIGLGGRHFLAERVSNPLVADLLLLLIPMALFTSADLIRSPVLVYQERIPLSVGYSAASTLLRIICVALCVLVFRSAGAAIAAYSLSFAAASIVGYALAYRTLPRGGGGMRRASLPGILAVALPLGVSGILTAVSRDLAKWVVALMRTPEEYAVFSYGAMELPFINTLAGVLGTVVIVDMVRYAKENRLPQALRLFRRTASLTSYAIFPVMAFFLVAAEPFYRLLYPQSLLGAVPVFRVYLLILPARVVQYNQLLIAMGKSRGVMARSLISLTADILLSVVFVRLFGPIGASFASVLALYIVTLPINLFLISRTAGVSWKQTLPFGHILKCLLTTLPPTAAGVAVLLLASGLGPLWQLLAVAGVFGIGILPLYRFVFPEDYLYFTGKALAFLRKKRYHTL